jgi:hypothetical protein
VFAAVFVVERLSVGSSRDDDDDEATGGFPRRVGAECVRDDCGDVEDDGRRRRQMTTTRSVRPSLPSLSPQICH